MDEIQKLAGNTLGGYGPAYQPYSEPQPAGTYNPTPTSYGQPATYLPTTSQPSPQQQQQSSYDSRLSAWRAGGNTGDLPVGWNGGESGGAPQGPSQEELNAIYQPSMNYLNQAESQVRSDFPNVLDAAQKAYESAISELTGNKQKNLSAINESGIKAGQQKEDALSSARRLYDELRRGYSQRFGAATSAGGAASEIAGAEQQRQQGQVGRQYTDTIRQIDTQRNQLNTDFQTATLKLESQKQQSIQQATQDFQNKLLAIAQNKAQVESAKAQARLDALSQLRNQVFQINQQTTAFQQNLAQQRQAAELTLQQQAQQYGGYANTAQGLGANQYAISPSNLQVNTMGQTGTQTPTGQILTIGGKKYQYINGTYVPV